MAVLIVRVELNDSDQRFRQKVNSNFAALVAHLDKDRADFQTLRDVFPLADDGTLGPSGSFTTVDGKTVTVTNGIITGIV